MVDFELQGRKRALRQWLTEVPTHFEIHPFEEATTQEAIDSRLRQVIEQSYVITLHILQCSKF